MEKQTNKKDIYEKILNEFENDLNRFSSIEEKVKYLKSFGFAVGTKRNKENTEDFEK